MTLYKNVEDYWVVVRRRQAYEMAFNAAKKAGHTLPEAPRDPFLVAWEEMVALMRNPFLQRLLREFTHPAGLEGVAAATFRAFQHPKYPAEDIVVMLQVPSATAEKLKEREEAEAKLARRRARGFIIEG